MKKQLVTSVTVMLFISALSIALGSLVNNTLAAEVGIPTNAQDLSTERTRALSGTYVTGQTLTDISEGITRQGMDDAQVHDLWGPYILIALNDTPLYVSIWTNDTKSGGGAGYPFLQLHARIGDYLISSPPTDILAEALGEPILNASLWCHLFSAGPRCIVAGTYLAGGTTPCGFVACLSVADPDEWTIEDLVLEEVVGSTNHTYMVDCKIQDINKTTGENEVVICGWYTNTTGGIYSGGCALWVYHCDGSTLSLECMAAWDNTVGGIRSNALDAGDLKEDGYDDVVVVGWLRQIGVGSGARCWAFDGLTYPWVGNPDDSEGFTVTSDGSMMFDCVICDHDGDGTNESISVGRYWSGSAFLAFYVVEEWPITGLAATLGTYVPKTGYASVELHEIDAVDASTHEPGLDLIITGEGTIATDHYVYCETINSSLTVKDSFHFAATRDDLRPWVELRIEDRDSYILAWSWEESAAFSWNLTYIDGELTDYVEGEGRKPYVSPPSVPPAGRYPDHLDAEEQGIVASDWLAVATSILETIGWYGWMAGALVISTSLAYYGFFEARYWRMQRRAKWAIIVALTVLIVWFALIMVIPGWRQALDPVVEWLNGVFRVEEW